MEEVDRKKPALVGGLIVAVLSLIPYVNLANCCFCLWALVGGIVATKLLIDRSPQQVKSGDGAMIGLLAGLVGAAIFVVIDAPLTALRINPVLTNFASNPQFPPEVRDFFEQVRGSLGLRVLLSFISVFIAALFLMGFTVLGGLLGVALFEKRKGETAPPPPPQYPPQYPPPYPPSYPSTTPPPPSAPPPGEGGEPGGGSL